MVKQLFILIFMMLFSFVFAQEQSLKAVLLSTQKIEADNFVGFDSLENMYYIKNNTLFKKNKSELWQYGSISLGEITRVTIQNPLKIALFYEKFNTIILLDSQLNETQEINFSENKTPLLVSAMGIASQNRLWIYDSESQQIGLFDYIKNTFNPITPSLNGSIKYYDSDFNAFKWIDDKLNWYSCDVYGKIATLGKVSDFDQIQPITNQLFIFSKEGKIHIQDINTKRIYTIENIEKSFKNFYYKDQILSISTTQEFTNYKITIP